MNDRRAAAAVYYDGGCPLCLREIRTYRKMRGADRVVWVDVADPGTAIPQELDRDELLRRFTVQRADGRLARGAEGFAALWRALGPVRPFGVLADRRPFVWIGEGLYRLFLRLRRLWR